MSYAAVAASGPKQSPEEVSIKADAVDRAPPMPEIEPTDSSTHSLVDVDSPHVSSVPSDYSSQSIKTDTQAERLQHEAEDREREEEQRRRIQRAKERAKEAAKEAKEKAKEKASEARRDVRQNADNPVYMANAVVVAAFGAVLGYGAYRKYVANELSWKVVGLWTGVVGLFAAGDYYVSQYFFQKYPPKR